MKLLVVASLGFVLTIANGAHMSRNVSYRSGDNLIRKENRNVRHHLPTNYGRKTKKENKSRFLKSHSKVKKSSKKSKTDSPTDLPTSVPSISMSPTSTPSAVPTASPSISQEPSSEPTAAPSSPPTISNHPSLSPSSSPSKQPTSTPSKAPSSTPTKSPSSQPTSTPSSAPTSRPSKQPTSTPSSHPTASPSSAPSKSPTATPSFQPSATPSSPPSISNHPSLSPSASPSKDPTSMPSVAPSSTPTKSPSSQPTSTPSSSPSRLPTSIPSVSPSSSPTRTPSSHPSHVPSSTPSHAPSISQKPSAVLVSGTKIVQDNDGSVGVQSACPTPPNENTENYEEKSVVRQSVKFNYAVTADDDTYMDELINVFETNLNEDIFDNYIACEGRRSLTYTTDDLSVRRHLDEENGIAPSSEESLPIGVSSLPKDKPSEEQECSVENSGESCVVIDGELTLLFEADSSFSASQQQMNSLVFIKNALPALLTNLESNITRVIYMGSDIDGLLTRDGFVLNSNGLIVDDYNPEARRRGLTPFGFAIAFILIVSIVGLSVIYVKRRRDKIEVKDDAVLLRHLDYATSGVDEDSEDNFAVKKDEEEHDHNDLTELAHCLNDTMNASSPLYCTDVDDFKRSQSDVSNILNHKQNVCECNSATCELCRSGSGIAFVSVDPDVEYYFEEGVEVEHRQSLYKGGRLYKTPDTIQL